MAAYHCLTTISPLDTATGTRMPVRVASADLREITGLGDETWVPAMVEAPTLSFQLFNGDFVAAVTPGSANINLAMDRLKAFPAYADADEWYWPGAVVEVRVGRMTDAWPWPVQFKGRAVRLSREDQRLQLIVEVSTTDFTKNVLTSTYAGTGAAEGGEDIKGQVKPLAIGWPRNVEPLLINAVDNVYQFSGYGPIEAVTTLYERGSDFGAAVSDFADYAALVAAAIPPGQWATCLAEGLVRLGAPAYGVITGDIKGHVVGSSSPRLPGDIISALATIAGVDSGGLSTASLTSMDTAKPFESSVVLTSQVQFNDIAGQLALQVNHQAGVSLTGTYFVAAINMSEDAAFTLNAQGRAAPQVIESNEQSVSPPYTRTVIGAARSWRVHSPDEIASADVGLGQDGLTMVLVWQRSDTAPATPTGDGIPDDWEASPPAGLDPLWMSQALQNLDGTLADDATWSDPVQISGEDGQDGSPGLNQATVFLYQRAASTPSVPSTTATYTFSTGALTGHNNGWDQTIPAGSDPVYVISAAAVGAGATDTIASGGWATPVILAQDGTPGDPGDPGTPGANVARVQIYRRSATTPTLPSASSTFAFATGGITGLNNSWTITVPTSDGNPLWTSFATAASTGSTDAIASGDWSAATILVQDGEDGASGTAAISVALSNDSHVFAATSTGVVSDYTASGALIYCFQGATPLEFETGAGYPTVASRFRVAASGSGVTPGTIIDSGTYATAGNVTGVTAGNDTPYIDFVISGKDAAGTNFTQTVRQTFSKNKSGLLYYLTLTSHAITKQAPDAATDGTYSTLQIQGKKQEGATTSNFGWVTTHPNNGSESTRTNTASSALTLAPASSSGVSSYTIRMYDAASGGNLVDTEFVGVVFKGATGSTGSTGSPGAPGAAATSAYLTNESHMLWAYADGTVVAYTGASGDFKAFAGSTDISSSFTLSTVSNPQGLTIGYVGRTYTVSGGFDPAEDTATVTIRATGSGAYSGVTFDKVFSLMKERGGYEIVTSALPTTNLFEGRQVYFDTGSPLTSKLYHYKDGAWKAVIDVDSEIDGAQIAEATLLPSQLLVGDFENLVQNGDFSTGALDSSRHLDGWSRVTKGGSSTITVVTETGSTRPSLYGLQLFRATGNSSELSIVSGTASFDDTSMQSGILLEDDDELYFESVVWANASTNMLVDVVLRTSPTATTNAVPTALTGTTVSGSYLQVAATTTFTRISGAFKNETGGRARAYLRLLGPATQNRQGRFYNVLLRRRNNANMVVDGAIIARLLAADAVTADKIEAGAVTAAKINVTQLSAISAVIGLLRTATTGARMEIESNVIRVYDSSGALRVKIGNLA